YYRFIGKAYPRIESCNLRIGPFDHFTQINVGDYRTRQPDFLFDLRKVVHNDHSTHYRGEMKYWSRHLCLLCVVQWSVTRADIDRPLAQHHDATARADRLIIEAHPRIDFDVFV